MQGAYARVTRRLLVTGLIALLVNGLSSVRPARETESGVKNPVPSSY